MEALKAIAHFTMAGSLIKGLMLEQKLNFFVLNQKFGGGLLL